MENLQGDELVKSVGKRIKELRVKHGMTQADLAYKSNMEESAFQRIETGRTNPSIKTLLKISNALNVEIKQLFNFSELD